MGRKTKPKSMKLEEVHARLFPDDVRKLKQIAARKLIPWQTELRLLVHRALDVPTVTNTERDI